MARTQKSYTIVAVHENSLETSHYANAEALKDAIAKRDTEGEFMVFEGTSVEFQIDTTPRVTIGDAPKTRKPRAKKAKAVEVSDEKPTNGKAVSAAPQPKVTSLS